MFVIYKIRVKEVVFQFQSLHTNWNKLLTLKEERSEIFCTQSIDVFIPFYKTLVDLFLYDEINKPSALDKFYELAYTLIILSIFIMSGTKPYSSIS